MSGVEIQLKLFKKILNKDFRGGGLFWNFVVFQKFMPFLFPLYLITVMSFLIFSFYDLIILHNSFLFKNYVFLLFVSITPLFIHEITKGLKVAKAYFAILLSILIFIFGFIENFESRFPSLNLIEVFINILYITIVLQAIHTFIVIRENLSSRLYVKNLYKFLIKNNISEFCTYKNKYNNSFVENMIKSFKNKFKIKYINNLNDIKDADNKILVVPPLTSKVMFFNTDYIEALNGYFSGDQNLIDMISSKKIEEYSIAKFNTLGSYKYYVFDDEVLSYRSIYLKQINQEDRYKGYAWVLDLKSL